jgi:hypothetical protein
MQAKPFLCRSLFGNVENRKSIAAIFAFAFAPHSYKTDVRHLISQKPDSSTEDERSVATMFNGCCTAGKQKRINKSKGRKNIF